MYSAMTRNWATLLVALSAGSTTGCVVEPDALTDAEIASISDTITRLATEADGAVDRLDCAEGLKVFGNREPLFIGGGRVIRTLADLTEMCTAMVAGRTGAHYEVEQADAHVLSRNVAYLVREGIYTVEYAGRAATKSRLVITGIWERGEAGWSRVHFHESWQALPDG